MTSLRDTHIRSPRESGLRLVQPRGAHGARALQSWRLRLNPGESATHVLDDEETIVVLQEGHGAWTAGSETWEVRRKGVFDEPATALYLPPGIRATFTATLADSPDSQGYPATLEAILISTPATTGGGPALVRPAEVQIHHRGRGIYTRDVHDLFVRDPHATRLMVGETFNPPGHWSSFPPHKHDGRDGEPELEEIYHYRVNPAQGFGQQMLYAAGDETVIHEVRDGDVVVLPYGYHPVSSPPGYHLYYLWAMVGAERKLALYEDPAHRWIHDLPEKSVEA